jgi:hypothetical protein
MEVLAIAGKVPISYKWKFNNYIFMSESLK